MREGAQGSPLVNPLNNEFYDVKFIISKHLATDLKIRTLLSKKHDLQKILFGDVVFDDDLCKY
jgi:hypothetical protein